MNVISFKSKEPISKTIDIGQNGFGASLDGFGTIHGLTAFHPEHGLVVAEPYCQFDGSRFYDSHYVREHRARFLRSTRDSVPGFGIYFEFNTQNTDVEFEGLGSASVVRRGYEGLKSTTKVTISDDGELVQSCEIVNDGSCTQQLRYHVSLRVSLNRASYGQLTEGGPIELPKSRNELQLINKGQGFSIVNCHLDARLEGAVSDGGCAVDLNDEIEPQIGTDALVKAAFSGGFEVDPGTLRELKLRCRLKVVRIDSTVRAVSVNPHGSGLLLWHDAENLARFIVRRNLEYILGNCHIPLPSDGEVSCLITDHVALPLGWNRDNYWQARFLFDVHQYLQKSAFPNREPYLRLIKHTLRGHLIWTFRYAQRPLGYWHRSYLVTGRPKDGPIFQLDQQCYPILLLCDILEYCPEEESLVTDIAFSDVIPEVLELLDSKCDSSTGLFATEETPGDDLVEYPFHFSSHVLLWHTFSRLSSLLRKLERNGRIDPRHLERKAEALRVAVMRHFIACTDAELQPIFMYLTNGQGLSKAYHDANDIPTVFAREWGFVKSDRDIKVWENTMTWGLTSANKEGYYDGGAFAGLGSVHTPGPWPLGYFQMWKFAQMTTNRQGERYAWEKICRSMQWDGTFSEAVDVETGECISKAWFCWPGAMIASGLLQPGVRGRYLNM